MYKIGITGLIGSGKTTVCKIFETLGVPVFYADDEAKNLMQTNHDLKYSLLNILGPQTYQTDGKLNRKYIALKIFEDPNLLSQINALVHPVVLDKLSEWFKDQSGEAYALYESALITQKHKTFLDFVILVNAPQHLRLSRVMQRQNETKEDILKRMAAQPKEKSLKDLADFIIRNNGQPLIPQVLAIHRKIVTIHNASQKNDQE